MALRDLIGPVTPEMQAAGAAELQSHDIAFEMQLSGGPETIAKRVYQAMVAARPSRSDKANEEN